MRSPQSPVSTKTTWKIGKYACAFYCNQERQDPNHRGHGNNQSVPCREIRAGQEARPETQQVPQEQDAIYNKEQY